MLVIQYLSGRLTHYIKYLNEVFVISNIVLMNTKECCSLLFYFMLKFDDLHYQSNISYSVKDRLPF